MNACDNRMQALNAIGRFDDKESIAEIKDSDLKDMIGVLNTMGYPSVMHVIDNMIWTIYTDRLYLLSHTLDKDGDGDRKPMDDYVYKHITDYDIIIRIDMFGNITCHRCDK